MNRLYPGWESGKNSSFHAIFKASKSSELASIQDGFNCGDKILLPPEVLRQISKLKLGFPLLIKISKGKYKNPQGIICGVLEFSSLKGVAVLPDAVWRQLFKTEPSRPTLTPREGTTISNMLHKRKQKLSPNLSVFIEFLNDVEKMKIPKGFSCKFQPSRSDFIGHLIESGVDVKEFMERCLRSYTVLSLSQTISVYVFGNAFDLKIIQTNGNEEPQSVISLLGDVDLEICFSPPEEDNCVGRIRPKIKPNVAFVQGKEPRVTNVSRFSKLRVIRRFGQGKGHSIDSSCSENEVENQSNKGNVEEKNEAPNEKEVVASSIPVPSQEELRLKRLEFLNRLPRDAYN